MSAGAGPAGDPGGRGGAAAADAAVVLSPAQDLGLAAVITLGHALGGKDYYTLGHATRVAAYTRLLTAALGWPDELVRHAELTAFVHDIGKLAVSDRVLRKVGPLNEAEWQQVRSHPEMSDGILAALLGDEIAREARHHHERVDGTGYPDGLSGESVSPVSRAICIADAYDAMSHRRPYRRALAYEEAVAELRRCRGTHFDAGMVDAFLPVLERLRARKARAAAVAAAAAALVDPDVHDQLRTPEDMRRDEYLALRERLTGVLLADPDCVALITCAWWDEALHLVMDCDADPGHIDPVGRPLSPLEEPEALRAGEPFRALSVHAYGTLAQPVGWAPIVRADGAVAGVAGCFVTLDDRPAASVSALLDTALSNREAFGALLARASREATMEHVEAVTDDLTALYNHRYLQQALEAAVAKAAASDGEAALLLVDIDAFGAYNETHGWYWGDGALCLVGGAVERAAGRDAVACRYSEDTFAVLLPAAGREAALRTADAVLAAVAGLETRDGLRAPLSVSVGAAVCPRDGSTRAEVLAAARAALAAAKGRGGGQVAVAEPAVEPPRAPSV